MAVQKVKVARKVVYPESDGKPMAETDVHINQIADLRLALREYFRYVPDVYVSGNILLYYEEGNPKKSVSPDVLVVRGIPKHDRRTYLLWQEGKGPDVVIEVSSRKTQREDLGRKMDLYRGILKVQEYFLFDPLNEYLHPPLQGYRLVEGQYVRMEEVQGRLRSEVLGLELGVEEGQLRLYDPATGQKLLTPAEQAEALREAESKRQQAEQARQTVEERLRAVEAELQRLRAELDALRRPPDKST